MGRGALSPVTQHLRLEVERSFYPFALAKGFERGRATSFEVPFGRIQSGSLQWFDLQWEKYHRPCFILNFGSADEGMLDGRSVNEILNDRSFVYPSICRLHRYAGVELGSWFGTRKPLLKQMWTLSRRHTPEQAVAQAIAAFADIERWWKTGVVTDHMSVLG